MTITVYLTHLYASEMSIYGDLGNIISIQDVLEYNGAKVVVQSVGIAQELPACTDWYFIGGGADKDQQTITKDLASKSTKILDDLRGGTPMLAICGGYQLFGNEFITGDGKTIPGLGWFDITTRAQDTKKSTRSVGNIIIYSELVKQNLVGFENHSGQTYATSNEFLPLGKTVVGFGNNLKDGTEGCVKKNTVGCYLHGPCLAKNPALLIYFVSKLLKQNIAQIALPPEYQVVHDALIKRFNKVQKKSGTIN